jgi:3-hydroxymyristoyl/3-hydroxydecanoyl-(acyl carrier protein) dehydratase
MIIQHFDFSLRGKSGTIYTGSTYFGFFTRAALAHQIGLRDERWYEPAAAEIRRSVQFDYPDQPPYPKSMLRMIDRITCFDPQGGPHGLGFIQGSAAVDPELWFFKAHFFQDPVWPGSLGLESFIQLLKVAAVHYWGAEPAAVFESPALGQRHEWQYRGQILPTDNAVTVQAVITELNPHDKLLRADGLLGVDGRIIYRMRGFTLRIT